MKITANLKKRIWMSVAGVLISAVSVGIFKIAAMGVDPFQSLMAGLDKLVPVSFRTLYVIVNLILLVFSIAFNRHLIGVATFVNLFLLGYVTDWTYTFLQTVIVNPSVPLRLVCLLIGIVVICFGSSLYMTADLGVSSYDSVAITMADKWHWGRFKFVRIATDVVCVLIGCCLFILAGGNACDIPAIAGIGTIVTAFFMGPLIDLFNRKIARPMLGKN